MTSFGLRRREVDEGEGKLKRNTWNDVDRNFVHVDAIRRSLRMTFVIEEIGPEHSVQTLSLKGPESALLNR
jgi:hypothetical protein